MQTLINIGIERWRAKRALPGAKREIQNRACVFSDAHGPKLLVLCTEEQCQKDATQLFDNFCDAIQVVSGLVKNHVKSDFPRVPTLLFAHPDQESTVESQFQVTATATHELLAGLQDSRVKSAWWNSICDSL